MSEVGEKLINEVRMVAAGNPDFIYDEPEDSAGCGLGCLYVHKGSPSCLIGRALWNLGYIDSSIEGTERNAVSIDSFPGLGLDLDEANWLQKVQTRQDNGEPWGHCVGIS
jgi:hypothetical protein